MFATDCQFQTVEQARQWTMQSLTWKIAETQPAVSLATNLASLDLTYTYRQLKKAGGVYGPSNFVEALFPGMSLLSLFPFEPQKVRTAL